MTDDFLLEIPASRPIWLITLADLALLLVGFFVLVQATHQADRRALANGLRQGFGAAQLAEPDNQARRIASVMPVGSATMTNFVPGASALPSSPASIIAWARSATADPRVTLKITGATDGSRQDVDATTSSAALLAIDRARAVAAALAQAGAVPSGRMTIDSEAPRADGRRVSLTIAFGGEPPQTAGAKRQ